MRGKVILVGAGPGESGLMTLKGLEALKNAQVVVYDRLVGAEVLALVPESAEKLDVGKLPSCHRVPQEEINRILRQKALEGKRVVRLKGGDPFVFGRGGEELEALLGEDVDFEVVPGVTSAIAAASYAGIPVTHRDFCSSLHIISGRAKSGAELRIDYEALRRTGGTLLFLMGVAVLPEIVKGLLDAGMERDMPSAIVERAATPHQRRISAPLGDLPSAAESAGVGSPAVIIVGRVCALADKLCWFDRLPLRGRRVVVTRPRDRMEELAKGLRALGAEVIEYPCIATVPIEENAPLRAAIKGISAYEWLCFTSRAGVEAFWGEIEALGLDARALGGVKLAAIGSATAAALALHGLKADLVPDVYDAAHLGEALQSAAKGKILIARAEIGTASLTDALKKGGAEYEDIPVYRTLYTEPGAAIETGEEYLVTFTSASTVRGFAASLPEGFDLGGITALCIGGQTAAECEKYKMKTITAREASIDSLLERAKEIYQR